MHIAYRSKKPAPYQKFNKNIKMIFPVPDYSKSDDIHTNNKRQDSVLRESKGYPEQYGKTDKRRFSGNICV